MRMDSLTPYEHEYCNFVFTAPEGMSNCSALHVFKTDTFITSYWKQPSIIERIKFLFTGKINLTIWGQGMPPVSLCND